MKTPRNGSKTAPASRALECDIVISGAGLAGCTTAILLAEQGLSTLLIERGSDVSAHKKLCGHYILAGANDVLKRIGIWDELQIRGAVSSVTRAWSPDGGWVTLPDGAIPRAVSLERTLLDPLLRERVESLDGCTIEYGSKVVEVRQGAGRNHSVTVRQPGGGILEVETDLLVGADGTNSHLANLLEIAKTTTPNNRFMYWGYYTGVDIANRDVGQVWMLDPDVAVAFPTNDGKVQLGFFGSKSEHPDFEVNASHSILNVFQTLSDGPRFDNAELVRGPLGTANYPLVNRPCVPRQNIALVGDAALTSDPVLAVGCSWAFRTGEMLADSMLSYSAGTKSMDDCLDSYRVRHRFFEEHQKLIAMGARKAAKANVVQRIVRRSATKSEYAALEMSQYINQNRTAMALVNPKLVGEIVLTALRK